MKESIDSDLSELAKRKRLRAKHKMLYRLQVVPNPLA
jgi:hypothetical protein